MAYTNKTYNKTTSTSVSTAQNLWCRDTFWQHIINVLGHNPFKETNGCRLRQCQYDSDKCRGAHCQADLKPYDHIKKYNRTDKANYNWVQLYNALVSSLETNASKIILEEHKCKIADLSTMNFIEIIQLWREFACYYRKISKEIPFKRSSDNTSTIHSSGYKYSDDVPGFYLDRTLEDTAWSFERLTRYCQTHKNMEANIARKQLITVWDLCLATGINCKEGVHYKDEHLCTSNFLTGTCSCPTNESLEAEEAKLQIKKIELVTQLTTMINKASSDTNEWSSSRGKKKSKAKTTDLKQELQNQITVIDSEISKLNANQRMIHYTELGMIPFNQQLINFRAEEEAKKITQPVEVQIIQKESWDHGIENITAVPKAIKITKLGGKKK